jgi:hypothetical protein
MKKWKSSDGMALVAVSAVALAGSMWIRNSMGAPRIPNRGQMVHNSLVVVATALLGAGVGLWLKRSSLKNRPRVDDHFDNVENGSEETPRRAKYDLPGE